MIGSSAAIMARRNNDEVHLKGLRDLYAWERCLLVARGMKLSYKQSYSVDRGVSNILQLVADDISQKIGQPYTHLDSIDWALRTGKSLTVFQRPYKPGAHAADGRDHRQDAVAAMMRRIGGAFNVRHVILVGGGAFLFKKAVKQAFASHQILEVKEPMFANVHGCQIAGTYYAQGVLASAPRPRAATQEGEGA